MSMNIVEFKEKLFSEVCVSLTLENIKELELGKILLGDFVEIVRSPKKYNVFLSPIMLRSEEVYNLYVDLYYGMNVTKDYLKDLLEKHKYICVPISLLPIVEEEWISRIDKNAIGLRLKLSPDFLKNIIETNGDCGGKMLRHDELLEINRTIYPESPSLLYISVDDIYDPVKRRIPLDLLKNRKTYDTLIKFTNSEMTQVIFDEITKDSMEFYIPKRFERFVKEPSMIVDTYGRTLKISKIKDIIEELRAQF